MAVTAAFPSPSLYYCRTNYSSNTRDECKKTTFIHKATHALSIGVNSNIVAEKVNEIYITVEGVLWCPYHPHSTVFGHANYSSNTRDEYMKITFPHQTTHALSFGTNKNIVALTVNEIILSEFDECWPAGGVAVRRWGRWRR